MILKLKNILFIVIGLLPALSFAHDLQLLAPISLGERWSNKLLKATKAAVFNQSALGVNDANSVVQVTLGYFTADDCTGSLEGTGFYSTSGASPTYAISVGVDFGLVATAAWTAGSDDLSIGDMTLINSIAVTLKSTTDAAAPQANFSNVSFACVRVDCTAGPAGTCTPKTGETTKSFTLKTLSEIGDPASGGVVACKNTGAGNNLYDLVVPPSDNSTGVMWGVGGPATGANSNTDGATNTASIVACFSGPGGGSGCPENIVDKSTYAAGLCSIYAPTGGYTDWFLPAGSTTESQLQCIYDNRAAIGHFDSVQYWGSSQRNTSLSWRLNFNDGTFNSPPRGTLLNVRCAQTLS